ncbi:MAG: T9SS type A sorting domain-containing protein [Ignavibacteria bacterium]|nr:T9SS type A sorting domain-containing protein [Ignavibacteria bacterium]
MAIDKFNNIYISGYGRTGLPFDDDFITIKYNSNGIREWVNVYASVVFNTDMSNSIVVDDSCNVYPSGYGSKLTGNEIITIKYSTTGEEKWIRRFPTNYSDILRFTLSAVDKYNNVIVNGYYYLGEQYAFNTIKYNSSGDLLWNRIYKGDGNLNFCFALCTDDSANVYAAGRNTSTGTGNDFLTIKYNQYGDTSWIRIYDGGDSLHDEIKSIAVDNFENVFVTGVSQSSTIANMDYLTIKYNSYGDIVWKKKYNGVGMPFMNDISYAISIDNNGSVIISGNSELSNTNSGFVTLEYSFITNTLENIQSNYSFSFLLQNYPNPFNPITNINYQIAQSGFVTLKIYNLLGKEIETLINEEKYSGKHIITFNGSNYSSGIYCYSLYFNNTILDTKRMLLIK